ncbi:hypothetical protein Tco_1427548 [Tanacetum coccineum]
MSEKEKDPEVIGKKISHKPIDYENLNSLTDDFEKCFSPQQELSAEQAFWFHILNPSIESSFTPPVIVEVPSELPKVSLVNASLKKLKFHLTQFDSVVKKRTIPNALEEGVKYSTSNCGSKPPGNKRNDKISQTPSRNKKNKVEAQPSKVNRVVKHVYDVDVKHSLSKANSKILCCPDCTVRFRNDQITRIMRYGDYQLGNVIISRDPKDTIFVPISLNDLLNHRRLSFPKASKTKRLDAPSTSIPSLQEQEHSPIISQGFEESPKTPNFHDDPLNESPNEDSTSQGSSSNIRQIHTPFEHLGRWTKDHPIANVIGDPSRSVSMRKQLETDAMWFYFDAFLTLVEPKNFKQAMTEPSWIDAMQDEIHEFERFEVCKCRSQEYDNLPNGRQNVFLRIASLKEGGLQISQSPRGIFINQSKYASEIVKKYGLHSTNSVDTPMIENKKLDEDLQGKPVNATLYHGMIGSLMYFTSSRPDLNHVVCLCARY